MSTIIFPIGRVPPRARPLGISLFIFIFINSPFLLHIMTDISIDDMITARTEARSDFKKGGEPRTPHTSARQIYADMTDSVAYPDPAEAAVNAAEEKQLATAADAKADAASQRAVGEARADAPTPGEPTEAMRTAAASGKAIASAPEREAAERESVLESILTPEILEGYRAKTLPKELQDAIQSLYDNYAIVKSATAEFSKAEEGSEAAITEDAVAESAGAPCAEDAEPKHGKGIDALIAERQ